MDISLVFAKRLKQMREDKGLSQGELAEQIGVSRGSISFYENGNRLPDISVLYKLCQQFDVTSDYMIGTSDFKNTEMKKTIADQMDFLSSVLPNLGTEKHMRLIDCFVELVSCDNMDAGDAITDCLLGVLSELTEIANRYKDWLLFVTLTHSGGALDEISERDEDFALLNESFSRFDDAHMIKMALLQFGNIKSHAFEHGANINKYIKIMVDVLSEVIDVKNETLIRQTNCEKDILDINKPTRVEPDTNITPQRPDGPNTSKGKEGAVNGEHRKTQ